ncbi:amidase [Candidatus Sumerlaeota bacterium]|nr:amidase [Candidatus Sumerlaeota bacterium]
MKASEVDEICFTPAVKLAKMIAKRRISPVEVTDAFLDRIERINPKLNAYVTLLPEQARKQARAAERAIGRGKKLGKLHGLPISIKDLAWTRGVRTTSGSRVFADRVPECDAPVVERLLGAGAIHLGKTNTPEFGWVAITDNEVFGKTNNPWNPEYTTSGSSGGAAAAQAAGLAALSHGSDGGGSIRHPASFCGVFGFKSTFGLIPRHAGVDGWPTLSHNGPITRTVADAALMLDVMCGYDARDMMSAPLPPQKFLKNLQRNLKGLRVAWSTDMGFCEVDPRVRRGFEKAIPAFKEIGCKLQNSFPDVRDSREIFKGVMFAEAVAAEFGYIGPDGTSKMNAELTKFIWKRRDILARDYLAAMEKRHAMYSRVEAFMRDVDILVTPTMAIPPFKHPKDMSEYPHTVNGVEVSSTGWQPFTFPFNLTQQPAATLPCGFTDDGLPIGLQVVGRRFEDLLVMQLCAAFEQARPWADKRPSL